jgi:hypothetical protein
LSIRDFASLNDHLIDARDYDPSTGVFPIRDMRFFEDGERMVIQRRFERLIAAQRLNTPPSPACAAEAVLAVVSAPDAVCCSDRGAGALRR